MSTFVADGPPWTLAEWLSHCERLHPKAMDFGLQRIREVAGRLNAGAGLSIRCPVIAVAGTNGKGSSCAMLESILGQAGYKTGLHTSPHLVHFEERLRICGEMCKGDALLPHFERVEHARLGDAALQQIEISLSFFEFTLLVFVDHMASLPLDVVILEVGLGGRLDAVNLFDADCVVITSIDLDHTAYLGDTREAIGLEKAHIMRTGKPAIVSDPMPPSSVLKHAADIGADLWTVGRDFSQGGDEQQWNWAGRGRRYPGLAYPALRGANQLVNASGVLAALTAIRNLLPVTAQAIRNGLATVELPGRFQILPGQPTLVLDVAHNPHSVAALTANLDAMGYHPTTHAVFGAMADKDLSAMLGRIAPVIDRWYFTDLPTPRAATAVQLHEVLLAHPNRAHWTSGSKDQGCASQHRNVNAALAQALACAEPADRIVVFGSFVTVGGALQASLPRASAKHLPATQTDLTT